MTDKKKKKYGDYLVDYFAPLLVNLFPMLASFYANAGEVAFSEITASIGIICIIVTTVFVLSLILVRKNGYVGLVTLLFSFTLVYYSFAENVLSRLFTSMRYWQLLPFAVFLAFSVAMLATSLLSEQLVKDICKIVCLIFAALIIVNGIISMPKIVSKAQNDRKIADSSKSSDVDSNSPVSGETTNIYVLLFDEYAGFRQMKDGYGYDNEVLRNYLNENNFIISENSRNESMLTTTIITNLVNLEYVVDNYTDESEKELLRKNGKLYNLLADNGYKVQIFEHEDFLGNYSPTRGAATAGGSTINGDSFNDLTMSRCFLYPFLADTNHDALEAINDVVEYTLKMEKPDSNTFTFIYLNFPHQPFTVDENGEPISVADDFNWTDKNVYLGQFKYATKLMMQLTSSILEKDPHSAIILCSDHGARATVSKELFTKGYYSIEYTDNPFMAIYCKGEHRDEIKDLSSVNTLRKVLSIVLGKDMEIIDVPEDVYNY